MSVRFGLVLGSRGWGLTTFENRVRSGGLVSVTHPHNTRSFLTIAEACEPVVHAAAIGEDGETMALDLGDPVRLIEVARTLIAQYGQDDVGIVSTRLRQGEELPERLFGADEMRDRRPHQPLASHVRVSALDVRRADRRTTRLNHDAVSAWLRSESVLLGSSSGRDVTAPRQAPAPLVPSR